MAERPDEKVVARVVVNLGEAQRLEQQEADDQSAIEHQRNVGQNLGVICRWAAAASQPTKLLSTMGASSTRPAPKKLPSTLPRPPTITIATTWIDTSRWNCSGVSA